MSVEQTEACISTCCVLSHWEVMCTSARTQPILSPCDGADGADDGDGGGGGEKDGDVDCADDGDGYVDGDVDSGNVDGGGDLDSDGDGDGGDGGDGGDVGDVGIDADGDDVVVIPPTSFLSMRSALAL